MAAGLGPAAAEEASLVQHLYDYVRFGDTVDTAGQLLPFFTRVQDGPWLGVLKLCNQSAVAPLFVALKAYLGVQFPYKVVASSRAGCARWMAYTGRN